MSIKKKKNEEKIYFFNDQNLFFKTQTTWGFQVNKERLIVGDVRLPPTPISVS